VQQRVLDLGTAPADERAHDADNDTTDNALDRDAGHQCNSGVLQPPARIRAVDELIRVRRADPDV
jgi:hypothetical protein